MNQYIDNGLNVFLAEYTRDELSEIIAQGKQSDWATELANESKSLDCPYTQEEILNWLSTAQSEWADDDSEALDKLLFRSDLLGPLAEELKEAKIQHRELIPGVFSVAGRVIAQSKNGMIAETTADIWGRLYAKTTDPKGRFLSDAARKVQHQAGFAAYEKFKALDAELVQAEKELTSLRAISVASCAATAAHLEAAKLSLATTVAELKQRHAAVDVAGIEYDTLIFNQLKGIIIH